MDAVDPIPSFSLSGKEGMVAIGKPCQLSATVLCLHKLGLVSISDARSFLHASKRLAEKLWVLRPICKPKQTGSCSTCHAAKRGILVCLMPWSCRRLLRRKRRSASQADHLMKCSTPSTPGSDVLVTSDMSGLTSTGQWSIHICAIARCVLVGK